jgi:hypothetical protein
LLPVVLHRSSSLPAERFSQLPAMEFSQLPAAVHSQLPAAVHSQLPVVLYKSFPLLFHGCLLKCFEAEKQVYSCISCFSTLTYYRSFAAVIRSSFASSYIFSAAKYMPFLAAANHNKFSSQRHCSLFFADKYSYFTDAVLTILFFLADYYSPFQLPTIVLSSCQL